jgi:hypothetical protein
MKGFKEYCGIKASNINEGKSIKSIVLGVLDNIWSEMETKKGRWYATNAPKGLVAKAVSIYLTKKEIDKITKIYNDADTDLSFEDFSNSNTKESEAALDIIVKVHEKIYNYVDKHGDDQEWRNKWGDDFGI